MDKDEYPVITQTDNQQFPRLFQQLNERGVQWMETNNGVTSTIRIVFEEAA